MTQPTTLSNAPNIDVDLYLSQERNEQMLLMANRFYKADCFTSDIRNPFQAYVKIQAGIEMGLAPMEAMQSLYIVNGKVTLWGSALSKRLRENGWKIIYKDEADKNGNPIKCTVTIKKDDEEYEEVADINEKVLQNSKAMKFAPKDKLRWHALGRLVRFQVPEILGGKVQYLKEEAEDFKEEPIVKKLETSELDEPERPNFDQAKDDIKVEMKVETKSKPEPKEEKPAPKKEEKTSQKTKKDQPSLDTLNY